MLTRLHDFVRGKLIHSELDGEFNHGQDHINRILLTTPLTRDLDFNGFAAKNFRARQAFQVRDASEYASISDAVASIPSGDAGVVFLPSDTVFTESAKVTVPDNVSIVGAGWSSVVKRSFVNDVLFDVAGSDNVRLLNFKIDGGSATTSFVPAIDANNASTLDFWMEGVFVENWGSTGTAISGTNVMNGVDVRNAPNAVVVRNKFEDIHGTAIHCGVDVAGSSQLIAYNEIYLTDQYGIHSILGRNVKIVHNQLNSIDYTGIQLDDVGGLDILSAVEDNQLYSVGKSTGTTWDHHGIFYGGTTANADFTLLSISRNQIYLVDNGGRGIYVQIGGGSSDLTNLKVDENDLHTIDDEGIYLDVSGTSDTLQNASVDGNSVVDFGQRLATFAGIRVRRASGAGNVKNLGIRNNLVGKNSGNFQDGIQVIDATASAEVVTGIINGNLVFGTSTGRIISLGECPQLVVGYNSVATNASGKGFRSTTS